MNRVIVRANLDQLTLVDAADYFLRVALAGKAKSTRQWYAWRVGNLVDFVGKDRGLDQVLDVDLLEWYSVLEEGERSLYTLHGYVRAVRRFFRWFVNLDILDRSPARLLPLPRLPETGRYGILDADAESIIDAAKDYPRDYALILFIAETGCRVAGAAGLRLQDLDLNCRRARVVEKFNKGRTVFFTTVAENALQRWLGTRPVCGSQYVFVGKAKGDEDWHGLTTESIYWRFALHAKHAGINKNWSPHQWRHRLGRKLAEQGMSLGVIAQLLGHSSVDVTVRFYGQFAVDQLQEIYDKYLWRT